MTMEIQTKAVVSHRKLKVIIKLFQIETMNQCIGGGKSD